MNIKYQQWKLISFVIDAYKIIYPYIDFFCRFFNEKFPKTLQQRKLISSKKC